MVQVTVTGVAEFHTKVTVLLPREALILKVELKTLKETSPTFDLFVNLALDGNL
jgi:hypothetical protein